MQTSFFFKHSLVKCSQEATIWRQSDSTQIKLVSPRTKPNYLVSISTEAF